MPAIRSADRPRPPLVARLGLWRLTRHPAARWCYDRLLARGLFLAQLDRFERNAGTVTPDALPGPPEDVAITVEAASDGLPDALRDAPVAPDDLVVVARRDATDLAADGPPLGYCCCSERPVFVPELQRRLRPPGLYVWRVYVDPADRGRGVGTALVARAVALARTSSGLETVSALVAPDNLPSRRAFRTLGFAPTVRYTSLGLGARTIHRQRRLPSDT